jgi:DivIVA domain-containing protein
MPPDDRPTISSSRLSASEVARHTFGTVRRGYDTAEVRGFLESVAREFEHWEAREEELRQAAAEAEERARHPVLDESTVANALGEHSAQILRRAHEEAGRVMAQAEERAAAMVHEAQQRATETQVEAETTSVQRIAQAELDAASLRQQAEAEQAARLEAARAEGEALLERARQQGRAVVEQAQRARHEVLSDMAQRRRALGIQIEQFRAARDELGATVLGLRDKVDAVVADLAGADDRARAAAAAAAPPRPEAPPDAAEDVPAAEEAGSEDERVEAVEVVVAVEAEGEAKAVEELFARLRAGKPAAEAVADDTDPTGEVETTPEPEGAPASEATEGAAEPEGDEDDALAARRAEVLDPVVAGLARRVKRALQDDQNRLLERLRDAPGRPAADLLPPEEEQRAELARAVTEPLAEAFRAGLAFAGGSGAGDGSGERAAETGAAELAGAVVVPLRRRLTEAGEETDPAELAGAAYREWRGERIERLVGDGALALFSAGVLAGAEAGVRWVAHRPACPDCDDNSLAGTVPAGQDFPTGHRHPPAHAGCRCLVTPAPG